MAVWIIACGMTLVMIATLGLNIREIVHRLVDSAGEEKSSLWIS